MILRSISSKLQLMSACAFLATGLAVITLVYFQASGVSDHVVEIVDDDQNEIYSLRLEKILDQVNEVNKTLASTLDDLGMTGTEMAVEYVADAQKSVIEKVREDYYNDKDSKLAKLNIYPFIVDKSGLIVVHPTLKNGEKFKDDSFVNQLVSGENGFSCNYEGVENIMFTTAMSEWNWIIGFAVPEAVILSPVNKVEAAMGVLVLNTIIVVSCIAGISIAALGWAIYKWVTCPLNGIIASLNNSSVQVTSSSEQLADSSHKLAECASEQAATLEETSASIEEISSTTKLNAESAKEAEVLSEQANKAVTDSSSAMSSMNEVIERVQASANETANIIKVIDEIAFQTNLLALNAAVEAARAGEAGKGFAVVAEEVRNLAMRSAEAAKNTSSLIEESVKSSKDSADITSKVGDAFSSIVGKISKTNTLVSEIAKSSDEQARGIEQINKAISQLDIVTQQNAANADDSSRESATLSQQSSEMNNIVSRLAALVGGNVNKNDQS